jgi:hypothetical protein
VQIIKITLKQAEYLCNKKCGNNYPLIDALYARRPGIVQQEEEEPCPFCGSPTTWRYQEHYSTCSICEAEWTECIVLESNCSHIKEHAVVCDKLPRLKTELLIEFPYVVEAEEQQKCSVCGKEVVADGW